MLPNWLIKHFDGDGDVTTKTVARIDGSKSVEESRPQLDKMVSYITRGMEIVCVSNTGKNGIELYLGNPNDPDVFYHLHKWRQPDDSFCTVLDELTPAED